MLVVLLLGATAAVARIVPGTSIAGITLGLSEHQVIQRLGKPAHRSCNSALQKECAPLEFVYSGRKLTVAFYHGRVVHIRTTSSRERTRSGLGVGTSKRTVLRRYPACKELDYCFLGSRPKRGPGKKGDRYTYLSFGGTRKVAAVIVGRLEPVGDECVFGCG